MTMLILANTEEDVETFFYLSMSFNHTNMINNTIGSARISNFFCRVVCHSGKLLYTIFHSKR